METLGEKIYALRRQIGLSQEELGVKIGVSRQTVSQWELNALQPKADNLKALCKIFSVSADYLLSDDEKEGGMPGNELAIAQDTGEDALPMPGKKGISLRAKVLLVFSSLLTVFIVILACLIVSLFSYPETGDPAVTVSVLGLSKGGVIAIVTLLAIIAILIVSIFVWYQVKNDRDGKK